MFPSSIDRTTAWSTRFSRSGSIAADSHEILSGGLDDANGADKAVSNNANKPKHRRLKAGCIMAISIVSSGIGVE
jgi:hypothetical protein